MSNWNETKTDYLVIGAGLAGSAFARTVQEAGKTVRLLDKGRGVGGRAATRRFGETRVDHGAQYFTARGERLSALTTQGIEEGWLAVWCHGFPKWENGAIIEREPGHPRYAPPIGMNELGKRLAAGLEVQTSALVNSLTRADDGTYTATCEDGRTFTGDALILNLPPVQLLALAKSLLPLETAQGIEKVVFHPAWALMLRLENDIPDATWPAIEFVEHPVLGWVARDHTKRGPNSPPTLMVHGSGAWSKTHLEDAPETVQAALLAAVQEITGPLAVIEASVHRWRYALPIELFPNTCFWHDDCLIGGCGDWCDGPKVEGALESGWSLAERVRKRG
jgi:renalase